MAIDEDESQFVRDFFLSPASGEKKIAVLVVNKRNVTRKYKTYTQLWPILI